MVLTSTFSIAFKPMGLSSFLKIAIKTTMVSSEEICDLICEKEPNWCLLKQRLLKVDNLDRKSWGPIHPTSEG